MEGINSMKNRSVSKILDMLVMLGIILTAIALLSSPLIISAFYKSQFMIIDGILVFKTTAFIYLLNIPYFYALLKLKKLSNLVINNNPFSHESVKSLKTISICSFSEIFIFIGGLSYLKESTEFFKYIVLGAPIVLVTFICITIGFLCLVLSQLFEIAIEIKEENDKTI